MISKHKKSTQIFLVAGFNLIAAISLSALVLLNISFYYENDPRQQIFIFILATGSFFLLISLATQAFILPQIIKFRQWHNLAFIALVTAILLTVLATSAVYYWSVPTNHQVEICFDADNGENPLIIGSMVDPTTNRLYRPASFGDYPITIQTGTCEKGDIVTLFPRWWEIPRVTVMLRGEVPAGRFFVSINNVPAVVQFEETTDSDEPQNAVTFRDGFERGSVHALARYRNLFLAIKTLPLLGSALYLSLFLFGFSERMITHSVEPSNPDTGK